jgi:type IX secretion system PorP/SprF family membrane protein
MMAMKYAFIIVITIFCHSVAIAQTPQYSQFWLDKLGTNPALAGDDMGLNINTVTRTQWTRITSHFNTFGLCGDVYFPGGGGTGLGVGLNAQSNTEGEGYLRTQKFETAFSGWGTFGSVADFSLGISAGVINKEITNPDGLLFSDQLDPVVGAIYPTGYQFDNLQTGFKGTINVGFTGRLFLRPDQRRRGPIPFSKYIMFGGSMSNVSRAQLTFNDNSTFTTPVRYTFHGAINITNGNAKDFFQMVIQPYAIFQREQDFRSTTIGSRFFIQQFQWFTAFRWGSIDRLYERDAVVFGMVLAKPLGSGSRESNSIINISYSFDLTINGIGLQESGGTHEIGLSYRWKGWHYDSNVMRSQGHRQGRKKCPGYF